MNYTFQRAAAPAGSRGWGLQGGQCSISAVCAAGRSLGSVGYPPSRLAGDVLHSTARLLLSNLVFWLCRGWAGTVRVCQGSACAGRITGNLLGSQILSLHLPRDPRHGPGWWEHSPLLPTTTRRQLKQRQHGNQGKVFSSCLFPNTPPPKSRPAVPTAGIPTPPTCVRVK